MTDLTATRSPEITALLRRGIHIVNPRAVEIGPDVPLDRLSGEGVEIYGPARIAGENTSLGPHTRIGTEGPIVLVNCQLGPQVELGGGFFTSSVFHAGSRVGSSAHIREACILEEESKAAHSVGLKHTILFPFVTLGSLINFCDCLMAGGTDRKNHSEVGSSFIHFNFTPNQDKATASLIGDVPRGVMLNCPPIFLGGQGGIVGPVRLGYGTVTRAGAIIRQDDPEGGHLLGTSGETEDARPFYAGFYRDLTRRIRNNIAYVAHVLALRAWYRFVRKPFMAADPWNYAVYEGALKALDRIIEERRYRMEELASKMNVSIKLAKRVLSGPSLKALVNQSHAFAQNWPAMDRVFTSGLEEELGVAVRERFVALLSCQAGNAYLSTIKSLDGNTARLGTRWLKAIADGIITRATAVLPSLGG